jgi:hypothetical protein
MNNTNEQRQKNVKEKKLTDYAPSVAIRRIRFYADVLEAHFDALGLVPKVERDEKE